LKSDIGDICHVLDEMNNKFSSGLEEYFKKMKSRYKLSIIYATFKLLLCLFK